MPPLSCVMPLSTAPLRGQSPAFFGLAPLKGFGRQLIPVQEPVLTAQTKVFSSPVVWVFFAFAMPAMLLLLLKCWPM